MRLRVNWIGLSALLLTTACGTSAGEPPQQTGITVSALNADDTVTPTATGQAASVRQQRGPQQRVTHRSHKDPEAKHRAKGRRELTAEEQARYNKTVPKIVAVRPTQLLLDRVQESQTASSARSSANAAAAPADVAAFGSDIVTAVPSESTARVAAVAAAAPTLPRSVDNSKLPAFPEIRDQGAIGSCTAFAIGYYSYTYALGKLLGWNNKNATNTTKVSPKWLYNLVDYGEDIGSSSGAIHQVLSEHGAVMWSEFPYSGDASNPLNYRAWPTSAATWKNALRYKSTGFASLGNPADPAVLAQAKTLLANGQVLNFSTFISSWEFEQLDNDPATNVDDAFVGQNVVTWEDGYEGGHEATIVGYNEDLWVDVNANGVVESSEKGALKIANSWGPNWMNSGFVWVAYDALQWTSQVPNGPSSDSRAPVMGEITALLSARTNYQPQLTAEFTVSTASRGDLSLALLQTELDRTDVVDSYQPPLFNYAGPYAFDGTTTNQAKSASFTLDLSAVALSYGDLNYRIRGENQSDIASRISGFSLTDRLRNNLKTNTTEPVANINRGESKFQSVRYKFQDPARVPQVSITPSAASIAFGSLALGQAAQKQLMVRNTGTGDLAVSSLRFSNALFLNKGLAAFRVAPGASLPIDLEFAPAASQSETATLAVRNTSVNQPNPAFALSGTGTSTNDSAPYQVFITQQDNLTDNSLAFRAELKSRVATTTSLSGYQIVYYLNDPGLDPTTVLWETFYSNVGPVTATLKRVYLTHALGARKADLALTFRFAPGARLPARGSVIFQGSLHRGNYSWYPNEADDWSRYLRRDGLAEGTIVQRISNQSVVFGLAAESPTGAYQLSVSPNPTTAQATATFTVTNPSEIESSYGLYIYSERGDLQDFQPTWVWQVGAQTVNFDTSWYPAGKYTAVIRHPYALDSFSFTKQ